MKCCSPPQIKGAFGTARWGATQRCASNVPKQRQRQRAPQKGHDQLEHANAIRSDPTGAGVVVSLAPTDASAAVRTHSMQWVACVCVRTPKYQITHAHAFWGRCDDGVGIMQFDFGLWQDDDWAGIAKAINHVSLAFVMIRTYSSMHRGSQTSTLR